MAVELASAYVQLIPSAQGIAAALAKELGAPVSQAAEAAGKDASDRISKGLLGGTAGVGKKLATQLGLVAVGAAAIKSAVDVEDAQNIIIRSTGASGKAAEGLERSFRNVASGTAASFEDVAKTMSELFQRTGLQGKALEGLTNQVLTFNRINKDSPVTVDALTKALAGFNVPAKQMGTELDHLFVIAQKTGVPLTELLTTLQTAGPTARQFGLSVDQTASLLANLNKAGLDASQVIPGLRSAFVQFAKAGRDPADALRETLAQMDALLKKGDEAGARQLAVQLFGARGSGLVDAALSGKVSLEAFGKSIDTAGAGILETGKKTATLGGALGILKNNAELALASFATPALNAANDLLRGLLPTIKSLGDEFATLPEPIKVGAAAAIALGAALGPLGNAAQGLQAVAQVGKTIASGFQLAAVRGLELVDSIKAISASVAANAAAFATIAAVIALPAAALAGLGFAIDAVFGSDTTGRGSFGQVLDAIDKAKEQGKGWAESLIVGAKAAAEPISALRQKIAELTAEGVRRLEAAKAQGASDEELAAIAGRYTSAVGQTKVALAGLKQQHRDEVEATKATKAALDTYVGALQDGAAQESALAQAGTAAQTAIQGFQDTLNAAAGGVVGYAQSQANLAKAQDAFNLAVFLFGPASAQAQAALLALNQAQLQNVAAAESADAAQQKLIDSLASGDTTYREQIGLLLQQLQLHPENAAGIQLEINKLNDAKTAADAIPGSKSTKVTADTSQFMAALGEVFGALAQLDQKIPGVKLALDLLAVAPHATGGIFTTPQVGLIAEAGPEAIIPLKNPDRALSILAQTGLFATAVPAQAGGGGLVIQNATFGDRDVITDLDYWARTQAVGV